MLKFFGRVSLAIVAAIGGVLAVATAIQWAVINPLGYQGPLVSVVKMIGTGNIAGYALWFPFPILPDLQFAFWGYLAPAALIAGVILKKRGDLWRNRSLMDEEDEKTRSSWTRFFLATVIPGVAVGWVIFTLTWQFFQHAPFGLFSAPQLVVALGFAAGMASTVASLVGAHTIPIVRKDD